MSETIFDINKFFNDQLSDWELAKKNYSALKNSLYKSFKAGALEGKVQYNPARAVSSLAKVDKDSIAKRACFLCENNRPSEQALYPILPGWSLLVNPYPILPCHFTIVSNEHKPQKIDIETGKKLSELLPSMVVFYNDAGAGASAPDHMHFQAVRISDLPLINQVKDLDEEIIQSLDLPFSILTVESEILSCNYPVNLFFWKNDLVDKVNFIAIPRKKHRPSYYYLPYPERRAVSPGAIDIAGIMVTPYKEDFDAINNDDILAIYKEVSL